MRKLITMRDFILLFAIYTQKDHEGFSAVRLNGPNTLALWKSHAFIEFSTVK